MKRALVVVMAVTACVALTGCGNLGMTPEKMREIAEAKSVCVELGGEFSQWETLDFGPNYKCDFSE